MSSLAAIGSVGAWIVVFADLFPAASVALTIRVSPLTSREGSRVDQLPLASAVTVSLLPLGSVMVMVALASVWVPVGLLML